MPNITDPTAVAFVNEVARPIADRLVGLKQVLPAAIDRWANTINAVGGAVDLAADGDEFEDGSHIDGRVPNTKAEMVRMMALLSSLESLMNGGTVFEDLNKLAVNPRIPS